MCPTVVYRERSVNEVWIYTFLLVLYRENKITFRKLVFELTCKS